MEAYTSFAQVYDAFMDNIPYDEWTAYVKELLWEHEVKQGIVLDLGCGTGSVTQRLAAQGYDMIGVDNSIEMLEVAREKAGEESISILYLLQDMREFELYGTVAAVVSICDSMNYILENDELTEVFRLVNNYLEPGGIFIFDLNTVYKYKQILADNTIAEDREEMSFIWDNYFDETEQINEYDLSIFLKEKENLYRKFEETHYQRAYSLEEIKAAIAAGGMEFVACYDAFTHNPPTDDSERIYVLAREKWTQGKTYIR